MTTALWQLTEVTLRGRDRPRLDGISVEIPRGVCAVMGHSGAGKTSLLNLLVGFERADAGRIVRVNGNGGGTERGGDGENDSKSPPLSIAPSLSPPSLAVYWVPADDGLWPHLTVRRHLAAVTEDEIRIANLLRDFDLGELAAARPATLSEGERSRLSVARALATGARVLVMDEPLVHVDPMRMGKYWDAVRQHCGKSGTSLVFASHHPETVLREAERVICLDRGRIAWQGAVRELYEQPPTPELAMFLGPVNWLEAGEAAEWLQQARPGPLALRPERLRIEAVGESPIVVEETRFSGAYAEVDLRNERTGSRRRMVHRPVAGALRRGMRVALGATLGLLLAVSAGCTVQSAEAKLPVKPVRVESLPVEDGFLPAPRSMDIGPDGQLYVLDDAGRVIIYAADGSLVRTWWMPEYSVGRPEGIEVLQDGRLAIADTHYHRVLICDQEGTVLQMWGEEGEEPGQFIFPCDVAQDPEGNLYVSEYGGNDRVQKFTIEGEFLLEFGEPGTGPGQFQRASGLDWHDGTVYVADAINNRVQAFSAEGKRQPWGGEQPPELDYPYDLRILPNERMLVVEYKSGRVTLLTLDGTVLGRYGSTGRGEGEFWTPWGLAATEEGRLVVADTGNRRIVELAL